jgi:acetyltransferase-like isoleucine patch superfamily enzyme
MITENKNLKLSSKASTLNQHINNNTKPLIFLGSNVAMYKLSEVCDMYGIKIHGIIDNDYFGNTEQICDIPVIDSEESLKDLTKLNYYKDNFNFFCAVNWLPENDTIQKRNRDKRRTLINLIDDLNLNCVSLIDPYARVSKYASVGKGTFIDGSVMIEHHVTVGDFVSIYSNSDIGHGSKIGRNCVFQRQVTLTSNSRVGPDCFFGMCVRALRPHGEYGENTFIQEGIYIRRHTVANEIVSTNGKNMRRVISNFVD